MKVRELSNLLNDLVCQGRGDYDVFVNLYGKGINDRMQDILDDHNWVFVDHTVVTEGFIVLDARPEGER